MKRLGTDTVTVGMKEYMHYERFTGLSACGVFEGTAPSLFRGAFPIIEDAPPFELRKVDPEVIRLVGIRYKAVHSRVDALFPCGVYEMFLGLKSLCSMP